MNQKEHLESTDRQEMQEAKKKKSAAITNAVFIGILLGIAIYGIAKNTLGFFALIPLFLAYKLMNKPKDADGESDDALKERD